MAIVWVDVRGLERKPAGIICRNPERWRSGVRFLVCELEPGVARRHRLQGGWSRRVAARCRRSCPCTFGSDHGAAFLRESYVTRLPPPGGDTPTAKGPTSSQPSASIRPRPSIDKAASRSLGSSQGVTRARAPSGVPLVQRGRRLVRLRRVQRTLWQVEPGFGCHHPCRHWAANDHGLHRHDSCRRMAVSGNPRGVPGKCSRLCKRWR